MKTVEVTSIINTETEQPIPAAEPTTPPRPVPAAGRQGSFKEALEVGMKKYDGVMRELAK